MHVYLGAASTSCVCSSSSYNAYPWGLGMSRGDGGCYGHAYIEGELRYFMSGEFET